MVKSSRVWKSEVAKQLLIKTKMSTIEEAVSFIVDSKLNKFTNLTLPVDLRIVASSFGIRSKFIKKEMDSSGRLVPDLKNYYIELNMNDSPQRQRFTAAHEIGHKALADQGIRITKYRNGTEPDEDEREEEDICDLIATYILGLRPELISERLTKTGFTFSTIDQAASECNTSFEATLRAFIRYCGIPAISLYCEIHGGLVGGVAKQFTVLRSYSSDLFPTKLFAGTILSDVQCLNAAMQQRKPVTSTEKMYLNGQAQTVQASARCMPVYSSGQRKSGVVMLGHI